MTEKKLYIVDCINTFRRKYVIEAETLVHAYDEITMRDSGSEADTFHPLTEKFLGETIVDGREITKAEFDSIFSLLKKDPDECTPQIESGDSFIRKINYE